MRRSVRALALLMTTGLVCSAVSDWYAPVAHAFDAATTPYFDSPISIPGTIQAEDFDRGGQGGSYWDSTPGNIGGAYRPGEDVDIAELSGGKIVVGWVDPGEWLTYTVNVATTGTYTVGFSVACLGMGGSFHLEMNGSDVTGAITVPNTGDWDVWQTVTRSVNLTAGTQVARLVMDTTGDYAVGNFDWMQFTAGGGSDTDTFRMMTWNINHGRDIREVYALPRQIDYMARSGADVIVLQEVSVWDEDQPTIIRNRMQEATGQTWYTVWAPGGGCRVSGCIGMEIVSRFPIAASQTIFIPTGDDRSSVAQALIYVAGVPVNIFANHLEYWDLGIRTAELLNLMDFARGFGAPRLVGGDFNSWWGEWWIQQMRTEYTDTKLDVTGTEQDDHTIGNVRFDYIFRSRDGSNRVTPLNCWVGYDADAGTPLSDHRPVFANFRVQ